MPATGITVKNETTGCEALYMWSLENPNSYIRITVANIIASSEPQTTVNNHVEETASSIIVYNTYFAFSIWNKYIWGRSWVRLFVYWH